MSGFDDLFGRESRPEPENNVAQPDTPQPPAQGYYPGGPFSSPGTTVAQSASAKRANRFDRPPRRRGRVALIASLTSVAVLAGLGGAGFWAVTSGPLAGYFAPVEDFEGPGTGEVLFTIAEGDIGDVIANNLVESGVIKSFDPFYQLLLEADPQIVFVPGVYKLKLQMSSAGALAALQNPSNIVTVTVVVPEGETMTTILSTISEEAGIPLTDVQSAASDYSSYGLPPEATSLEGFLFPATYDFSPNLTAREMLQAMVERCFESLDAAGVPESDRYRVIVFASLVQRESGLRDDYYRVARVFQNRLDAGWNLESDATVAYGTGNTHRVQTTDAERADASNPYNTYVHPGLPFAPISNPGDLAIDAVMHPADGPWMFFVTWNLETGETIFSETVDEHEAAVEIWGEWMADHPEYD